MEARPDHIAFGVPDVAPVAELLAGHLGGRERGSGLGNGFVFWQWKFAIGWPESPLRIAVHVQPDADEGPLALELAARRRLALPEGPHPALSLPLLQVEEK